jgi:hypothetical protein
VDLLIELDLEVVPVRSITRPVLESIALPELSMILVLGLFAELRLFTLVLVFTPVLLLLRFALLPETAERVFRPEDLPDRPAMEEDVLLAELLL